MDDVDWDRTVFTLINPDALARHRGIALLDRIESLGFAPVAWRVLWHRPADLDSFHERNITHAWKAYRYRLIDQMFAFGPTVALLMADRLRAAAPSHRRLVAAKGPGDPAKAGPGTIRGDLGSINEMLSLMHNSDSPADSAKECVVFTGPDGFTFGGDPHELRALLALLHRRAPQEARGHREVLGGLRAKTLTGAWEELPRPARKTAAAMVEAGQAELTAAGSGERLAALLPVSHPLAEVLRADFTPASPGQDLARVRLALRTYGADLDDWEDLVLATSRRFWPRGAAARTGSISALADRPSSNADRSSSN